MRTKPTQLVQKKSNFFWWIMYDVVCNESLASVCHLLIDQTIYYPVPSE